MRMVKCPRCKKPLMTRFSRFRHCKRLFDTEKYLLDDSQQPTPRKSVSRSRSDLHTLEVSW